MIVDDVESLKFWLNKTLSPVCDADPAALTNYIYALVKKDKPESEIRENCLDQLDVFLQNKTVAFVDSLFVALKDKSYVGLAPPAPAVPSTTTISVVSTTTPPTQQLVTQSTTPQLVTPDTTNTVLKEITKSDSKDKDKKRPDEALDNRSRESRRKRSRSRSRSSSPRRRDGDERRRRYDRSRYSPPGRRYGRRRSRSRSPGRRWSPDRRRSRSPRNRSRDKSRSPRSRSRSRGRQPDSRGSTPTQDNGNYSNIVSSNTGSRIPSSIAVVTSTDDNRKENSSSVVSNPRCRDYDEKGFCMRGDLCPFDHGVDPVIVEDSGIPCVIPFPPTTSGPPPPGIPPPPGMPPIPAGPPPDFSKPPPPIPQRPPPPTEVYNPEAPGLTGPRPPFWQGGPRVPRPPGPGPFFNQPPPNMNQLNIPRQRDLVHVQTLPDDREDSQDSNSIKKTVEARVVVPSKRTYDMIEQTVEHPAVSPRRHFDFARLGGYRKPNPNMDNSSLEVRKIPRELNSIAKLNEHFGKFGTVLNLQICFEGDPEAALVTFSGNQAAFNAYRSSEPVFNNRFIKVFWHKKPEADSSVDGLNSTDGTPMQQPSGDQRSIKARLGSIPHHSKLSLNNKNKPDKEIVYTSSIGNLKKTVFNPSALKTPLSPLTSPTAVGSADYVKRIEEIKKKEDLKQEAIKKKVEIQKQKQSLLEKQINQQKILIEKLESNKTMSPEEKSTFMKALKTLTDSIEKLKLELLPQKAAVKNPDETRREILDTELELINKQNAGEDTTVLRLKLTQLTKEAQSLGLFSRGRGRGMRGRGTRARGMRGRGGFHAFGRGRGGGSMTLDNRPKVVEITNFEVLEKEEVKNHFALLGTIEKCEFLDSIPSAIITFSTRKAAEMAVARGSKYKNKMLDVRWYVGITRTISGDNTGGDSDEESALHEELDEDALLAGDDEEEEDEESRSWRR